MIDAETMIERLSRSLSPRARRRNAVALITGLAGALFVGGLWLTEPGPLPVRTRLAFGLLTAICLAWTAYGTWAVMRRTPLFARDRVIAGRIALAASIATTALTATVVAARGSTLEFALALTVGGATIVAAALVAVRAHAARAALLRRERELLERRDLDR